MTPRTESTRRRLQRRYEALRTERSSWVTVWRQLADYIMPRRFRDQTSQRNRPVPNEKLINNTPVQAARILASGLMGGLTSPARPWFRLGVPNIAKASDAVKGWLSRCEAILREVLIRSNVYNGLAQVFADLGVFATAAMLVEEDEQEVVRAYVLPLGSFVLMVSARGQVDGIIRELPMTVSQTVEQFGLANCSQQVQDAYGRGDYDRVVDVLHAVEPNPSYDPFREGVPHMPYRSLWWEKAGGGEDEDKFLRRGGFREFPVMAPRWSVTGTDTYGSGPGFDALGDAKALQVLEKRKAMLVDRITNPPMVAPSALKAGRPSLLPGDVTFVDKVAGGQGFEPAIQVNSSAVSAVDSSIRSHEDRIQKAFYADLWLALTMDDRNERATAREVAERHEEKLLALGPVLERLHDELLDKLIERVFMVCMRKGLLPKPPPELQGQSIRVEYVSIMASAQKLLGVSAVERLAGFLGNIAGVKPTVLDKVDEDALVESYADMLGTPPELLRSKDAVAQLRAERAQQNERMRQEELAAKQGPAMAKSAELLSKTDVQGTSALNRLIETQGGGSAISIPQGGRTP